MNQALKQRLVGTLVLGCLAIIFIPLLLDGEGITPAAIEPDTPPPPDISYQALPAPERPVIEADSLPVAADVAAASASDIPLPVPVDRVDPAAPVADTTPQRGADGLPQGWTVRLGVFGNLANADKLRACLIASGYQAYSRQQQADTGTLTRVFVGPVATRAEASELGSELKGKCDLAEDGIAVPYTLQ
ncbi:MAG: SPOR domain-containing protein [Pseudohongiellaceae bacterium]